jgi:hypothetical protein
LYNVFHGLAGPEFESVERQKMFVFFKEFRPAALSQTNIQCESGLFPGDKAARAWFVPVTSIQCRLWSYTSTPPCILSWRGQKQFTFSLLAFITLSLSLSLSLLLLLLLSLLLYKRL